MAQAQIDSDMRIAESDSADQFKQIAASLWTILRDRPELLTLLPGSLLEARGAAQGGWPLAGLSTAVEGEYLARRQRDKAFGHELFGEPAWDMLLYLYGAHLRGEFVATSSLVRASVVPPTTALRWVAHLEQAELIERCTLKRDGRVRLLKLTRRALKLLELHFVARTAPQSGHGSVCDGPPSSVAGSDFGAADNPRVDNGRGRRRHTQQADGTVRRPRPKSGREPQG